MGNVLKDWKGQSNAERDLLVNRIERVVTSMRDRATDNPQGIKAETLAMFAGELELALKSQPKDNHGMDGLSLKNEKDYK